MEIIYSYDYDDERQRAVMFAVMDVMRHHAVTYDSELEQKAADVAAEIIHKIESRPTRTYLRLVFSFEPSTGEVRADLS